MLIGYQDFESLRDYMQKAKAFCFAAERISVLMLLKLMSCGTPVIAGNYGGTAESVIDGVTGILFKKQSVDSIVDAVKKI